MGLGQEGKRENAEGGAEGRLGLTSCREAGPQRDVGRKEAGGQDAGLWKQVAPE